MRTIFHIDMNSFFASCEQAENKSLKNKPIAVAGDPKKRHGIILAASYEAKSYGVKTTMPVWKALNLCKDLIIVESRHGLYEKYSDEMIELISNYAPVVEQASIDEAYLDFTGTEKIYPDIIKLAKEIQDEILNKLSLPSSIGISENKLLAKMGSNYKKPLGITPIYKKDVPYMIWPKKIRELMGVGRSTEKELNSLGILTIGDLAKYDRAILAKYLTAASSIVLINMANGIDDSKVIPTYEIEAKSIGNEITFEKDLRINEMSGVLLKLSEKVGYRLRHYEKRARTITIKVKFANFTNITKSRTLEAATNSTDTIYKVANQLLTSSVSQDQLVRLLGVTSSNLTSEYEDYRQISLFETKKEEDNRMDKAEKVADILKLKYGEDIIKRARNVKKKE